ncbi:hypothetical protein, partial [Escherichia coli]|uniref:hypothetical protein n=1 Tax=Escherichia coli TaxID=562 RepID=UPI003CE597AC
SRTALLFGPVAISVAYIARKRGLRLNTGLFTLVGFIIFQWILAWSWSAIFPQRFGIDQTMSGKGFDSVRLKMWPVLLDSL